MEFCYGKLNVSSVSKLINSIEPGSIMPKAINKKKNMNVFQMQENLNLAISAAKSIGCKLISIFPETFFDKRFHMILGMIWQLIRIFLVKSINIKHCPEIINLLEDEEELSDLQKLPAESILIRWFNFHLKRAGVDKRVKNLGKDLQNSEIYTLLLNQIDKKYGLANLDESDLNKRAETVIANATDMGVPKFIVPAHIVSGNQKLNIIFAANIFNTRHGLPALNEEQIEMAGLINDDIEGTREERAFRLWINTLNIEDVFVTNLYEEAREGILLLKVLEKIEPGIVDWKKVEKNPDNKFKRNCNGNYTVEVAKKIKGLVIMGIGGTDIADGKKKLILAIVWQLVRKQYLKIIGDATEQDIINWANGMVKRDEPIKSFKDSSLKNGKFLIELCASIEPRVVNWELMMPGENDEEMENNAKYAISIARKLGANIFCIWEDIVKANPKMMLVFICTLMELHSEMKKGKKPADEAEPESHEEKAVA